MKMVGKDEEDTDARKVIMLVIIGKQSKEQMPPK
jgi:hypothetical protein